MAFAHIYIYYIHPELRISDYRFRSGKRAGRFRGSNEGARGSMGEHWRAGGEHKGSTREHRVSTEGAKNFLRAKIGQGANWPGAKIGGEARLYEPTVAA